MKKLLSIFFALISFHCFATNYYFSNAGNNSNTGSQASPYATLAKISSLTIIAGDSVLLKRGDTFEQSSTFFSQTTNGLVFSAYGTGANPLISGMHTITGWANTSGNIWEVAATTSNTDGIRTYTFNGVRMPVARFPKATAVNDGYITITAVSGATGTPTITSALASSPSYVGAEVVVRAFRFYINPPCVITAHSGTTFTYTNTSNYPTVGYGFFLQNSVNCLTQNGDWIYDKTASKLKIYSDHNPSTDVIRAGQVDVAFYAVNNTNIKIVNIDFEGGDVHAIQSTTNSITVRKCNFKNCGSSLYYSSNVKNVIIDSCTFTNANAGAVLFSVDSSTVSNSTFRNMYTFAGTGHPDFGYTPIFAQGTGNLIEKNDIHSAGYNGITSYGGGFKVQKNSVDSACIILDDGGAYYTTPYSGQSTSQSYFQYNSATNTQWADSGTNNVGYHPSYGVYLDDQTMNQTVRGNAVTGYGDAAIFGHNVKNLTIDSNRTFGYGEESFFLLQDNASHYRLSNILVNDNEFVSNGFRGVLRIKSIFNDIQNVGPFLRNGYAYPGTNGFYCEDSNVVVQRSITSWVSTYHNDTLYVLNNPKDFYALDINATGAVLRFSFSRKVYYDKNRTNIVNYIDVQPYSSFILYGAYGYIRTNKNRIKKTP